VAARKKLHKRSLTFAFVGSDGERAFVKEGGKKGTLTWGSLGASLDAPLPVIDELIN
jgi:hypothetical protein